MLLTKTQRPQALSRPDEFHSNTLHGSPLRTTSPSLVAALTLTAKWLTNRPRPFVSSAKWFERIVIAIGLFCVMATGMTGSLAALGDTIFPSATLKDALVQDFSSNSYVLLRLRILHPVVAVVAVLYVLWMVQKFRRTARNLPACSPFLPGHCSRRPLSAC